MLVPESAINAYIHAIACVEMRLVTTGEGVEEGRI